MVRNEVHVEKETTFELGVNYFDTFATVRIDISQKGLGKIHSMTYYFDLEKVEEFLELFKISKIDIHRVESAKDNEDK